MLVAFKYVLEIAFRSIPPALRCAPDLGLSAIESHPPDPKSEFLFGSLCSLPSSPMTFSSVVAAARWIGVETDIPRAGRGAPPFPRGERALTRMRVSSLILFLFFVMVTLSPIRPDSFNAPRQCSITSPPSGTILLNGAARSAPRRREIRRLPALGSSSAAPRACSGRLDELFLRLRCC